MGCFQASQPLLGIPIPMVGAPLGRRVVNSRFGLRNGSLLLEFALE